MTGFGRRSPIETRAFVFDLVCQAAVAGQRCPTNGEIANALEIAGLAIGTNVVVELCKDGHLQSRVYAKNYRVVVIRTGPHAGKRTKPPTIMTPAYKVVDNGGPPAAEPMPTWPAP